MTVLGTWVKIPEDSSYSPAWKELLLYDGQLLNGAAGGVLQAIVAYIATNPTATNTFAISDGTTVETFTFVVAAVNPFEVTIGVNAAATQTNLVAAIVADSALWKAYETTGLDGYFAANPATQFVVARQAVSTNPDRLYGTLTVPTGIAVANFAATGEYQISRSVETSLPATDPALKTFGLGRNIDSLITDEVHTVIDTGDGYLWDDDGQAWVAVMGLAMIPWGLVGDITTIDCDDAAAAGTVPRCARGDHQHAIVCSTPVSVGTANAEGVSTGFARSDHVHDSPAPALTNKHMTCSVTVADGDPATAVAMAATPALDGYVRVSVNGLLVTLGDGVKTGDCYFSGDAGLTARAITAIIATDTCHWVGTVAGYQLAATDFIDFDYEV